MIRDKNANAKQVLRACELLMLLEPQVPTHVKEEATNSNGDKSLEELAKKTNYPSSEWGCRPAEL